MFEQWTRNHTTGIKYHRRQQIINLQTHIWVKCLCLLLGVFNPSTIRTLIFNVCKSNQIFITHSLDLYRSIDNYIPGSRWSYIFFFWWNFFLLSQNDWSNDIKLKRRCWYCGFTHLQIFIWSTRFHSFFKEKFSFEVLDCEHNVNTGTGEKKGLLWW